MSYAKPVFALALLASLGCGRAESIPSPGSPTPGGGPAAFDGSKAGDEREVAGVKLCWCPPGRFLMGSPPDEPERRPGEDQVEVTLTKGFWMAKYEAMQGPWKRVAGELPGPLTAELSEGDDYPVGNVNFAEAEDFCQRLTELGRRSGELPSGWEFRLPTEAQWEYACRAGTTTATSFGDRLSSKQANFKGKPYNGAEPGPSLGRAAKVGSYAANAWGLGNGDGTFTPASPNNAVARRNTPYLADLTGDGLLDSVVLIRRVSGAGTVKVLSQTFGVGKRRRGLYLRLVINTGCGTLTAYLNGRVVKRWPYKLLND